MILHTFAVVVRQCVGYYTHFVSASPVILRVIFVMFSGFVVILALVLQCATSTAVMTACFRTRHFKWLIIATLCGSGDGATTLPCA